MAFFLPKLFISKCLDAIYALSFRDAPLGAGPESILPVVVMDSGLALCAPPEAEPFCERCKRITAKHSRTPQASGRFAAPSSRCNAQKPVDRPASSSWCVRG